MMSQVRKGNVAGHRSRDKQVGIEDTVSLVKQCHL